MEDSNFELSLLDPEEKELLSYIWNHFPREDREGITQSDVLLVLDLMDDFLAEKGLLEENEQTGEVTYLEGEVDETEQLSWLMQAVQKQGHPISAVQMQIILDSELQFGIEKGYYSEEDDDE